MLIVNQLAGFGAAAEGNPPLIQILAQLGLTAGLKLCLDAGDIASWPGSGQKWLDTSGGGHDFFRGTGAGTDGSDPTFHGTPGGLSADEYWSSDGGDFFTYDSANEPWMNELHQNNAISTILAVFYAVTGSAGYLVSTFSSGSTQNGIVLQCGSSNNAFSFRVARSNASLALNVTATDEPIGDAVNFVGLSWNEQSTGFFWLNGNYSQVAGSNTFSAAYASPSAGGSSAPMTIGALNNGAAGHLQSGERLACLAIWQGVALTKTQLDDIRTELVAQRGY